MKRKWKLFAVVLAIIMAFSLAGCAPNESCLLYTSDVPVIMWSVDPRDWESKNAEKVKASILEQATDGSIILVHDTNMGSINGAVAAMDELRARGYEIVNIPELLFSSSEPVSGKKYFSAKS